MTRTQIRDLIAQRLRRTDLNVEIEAAITLVQETILEQDPEFLPWFLETRAVSGGLSLAADASTLALPAGFIRELDEGQTYSYPTATPTRTNFHKLFKVVKDVMPTAYASDEAVGYPRQYSLFNLTMAFDRKADVAYTILLPAYMRDITLTNSTDSNNWTTIGSDWLIAEVLKKMASSLGNQRIFNEATAEALTARARLITLNTARENAGMDLVMEVSEER